MAKCRRCNRHLKSEPWASLGIGKICSKKEQINTIKQENGDSDIIVPYDGGDIWIERIAAPTIGDNGNLTIAVHACSGIKTNVQRSVYRHSPTGFNFGYGGSGPADLALNIIAMFCHDAKLTDFIYQDFKWNFCNQEQGTKLVIPRHKILDFIAAKKQALGARAI